MISINYVVDRIKAKVLIAELQREAAEMKERLAQAELRGAQIERELADLRLESTLGRQDMIFSMLARGDDPWTVQSVTDQIYRRWEEDPEEPLPAAENGPAT